MLPAEPDGLHTCDYACDLLTGTSGVRDDDIVGRGTGVWVERSTTATPANVFENIRPMVTRLIGIETVRRVRDEIRDRVETLLAELLAADVTP